MKEYKYYKIIKRSKGIDEKIEDLVIVEYNLSVYINDHYFVTLLCTPRSLEALVLGYLKSEGVIEEKEDVINLDINIQDKKALVSLASKDNFDFQGDHLIRQRTITSACGKGRTVAFPIIERQMIINNPLKVKDEELIKLMKMFSNQSELFNLTGGVHSCAMCTYDKIMYFEEDIGRHNALEKILGRALKNNDSFDDKIILTTGRISSEIMNKVALRGISMLVSRSAPTDQAIDLAKKINMVLIGFVRGSRMNIYN